MLTTLQQEDEIWASLFSPSDSLVESAKEVAAQLDLMTLAEEEASEALNYHSWDRSTSFGAEDFPQEKKIERPRVNLQACIKSRSFFPFIGCISTVNCTVRFQVTKLQLGDLATVFLLVDQLTHASFGHSITNPKDKQYSSVLLIISIPSLIPTENLINPLHD